MSPVVQLLTELNTKGIQIVLNDENLTVKGNKSLLNKSLLSIIKELKPELIACLKLNKRQHKNSEINVRPIKDDAVVTSFSQQRLWLVDKIEGSSSHYNMPLALRLSGKLDKEALTSAFHQILLRHESLRTYFVANESEQPMQFIQNDFTFDILDRDLSLFKGEQQRQKLEEYINKDRNQSFDLSRDLMMRVQLIKLAEQENVLLVTMHHIASDGWSLGILINEFMTFYQAFSKEEKCNLPPLPIQYADFAFWQRSQHQSDKLNNQLNYWTTQLANLPPVHNLPLDNPRPAFQSFTGGSYQSTLSTKVTNALKVLCQQSEVTLFMGLHAAFSVLLSRYSNETDIVMGTPTANREQPEVASLIGFFVNNLVLRSDLTGAPSFNALLMQSKNTLLSAYEHQQVPFEQIVEKLKPERSLSYSPLFQVMLVIQNTNVTEFSLPDLAIEPIDASEVTAKYDLTLNVEGSDQGLLLNWEYNNDLFKQSTISAMADNFEHLLSELLEHPDNNVFDLVLLSEHQSHRLNTWNETNVAYKKTSCIHEVFEEMVHQYPAKVALIDNGQQITYQQLNEKSNQLAHYLIDNHTIKPDDLVGICLDRTCAMVVAILATLKAGGAYVPLDPSYPKLRLSNMIDDANLRLILTKKDINDAMGFENSSVLYCDNLLELDAPTLPTFSNYPTKNIDKSSINLTSSALAYVIYTSGSTGRPKGVMVEHRNLVNYHLNIDNRYEINSSDNVLQFSTICFDIFVEELFGALCNGASLALRNEECIKNVQSFNQFCDHHNISVVSLPTAFWHQINEGKDKVNSQSLKTVILGGEALSRNSVIDYFSTISDVKIINTYGPTEATITACGISFDAKDTIVDLIPIGKANINNQLLILNKNLQLCPVGVVGELYIGGDGLARGYLHNQQLTDENFIKNPFFNNNQLNSSDRIYKTGDLVRCLEDGNIEFIGRVDDQVKIRGFRIELAEIAHQISSLDSVDSAIVLTKALDNREKKLVAYIKAEQRMINTSAEQAVVQTKAVELNKDLIVEIEQYLSSSLPNYMVPKSFSIIEEWPLTPNGKIDKKVLLSLPELTSSGCANSERFSAPVTEIEIQLSCIWATLLHIDGGSISQGANFFELGGHSLLIGHLVRKISEQFYCELNVVDVYQHQHLNELATFIESKIEKDNATTDSQLSNVLVELKQGKSNHPPLFLIPPVGGSLQQYVELVNLVDFSGAIYCLRSEDLRLDSIENMASKYCDAILKIQPDGTYYLGGWSMGGVVALALAQQLNIRGKAVKEILMIDSFAPALLSSNGKFEQQSTTNLSDILQLFVKELAINMTSDEFKAVESIGRNGVEPLLAQVLKIAKQQLRLPPEYKLDELIHRYQLYERDNRALLTYSPTKFSGAIRLIRASQNTHPNQYLGWQDISKNVYITHTSGDHYSMFLPPFLNDLASQVNLHIEEWVK